MKGATPKAKAGAKADRKLTTKSDSAYVVREELCSVSEQLSHFGSSKSRVPGTIELGDFFNSAPKTDEKAEMCYSLESPTASDVKPTAGSVPMVGAEKTSDLAWMVDRLAQVDPAFGVITRMKDLNESNFKERTLQRPVGYAATTRLHFGRLCVPILVDTGASCALMAEEQAVLLINHTMKMLDEDKIKLDDYNYPIIDFFKFKESAYLRSREVG